MCTHGMPAPAHRHPRLFLLLPLPGLCLSLSPLAPVGDLPQPPATNSRPGPLRANLRLPSNAALDNHLSGGTGGSAGGGAVVVDGSGTGAGPGGNKGAPGGAGSGGSSSGGGTGAGAAGPRAHVAAAAVAAGAGAGVAARPPKAPEEEQLAKSIEDRLWQAVTDLVTSAADPADGARCACVCGWGGGGGGGGSPVGLAVSAGGLPGWGPPAT